MTPIGLFDSGVGGLSIWQEIVRQLPHESTIYVADQGHCPYGPRSAEEIRALSAQIVQFLVSQECKLIVIACNTASAAALKWLRTQFDVPIVGLEPAIKLAAHLTQTGHVGLLATAGTLKGELFQATARQIADQVQLHVQVGTGLVEQVEAGALATPQTAALLQQHLAVLLAHPIDQIVLGCTHYPLLHSLMAELAGPHIHFIDSADAVARQVQRILTQHRLLVTGEPHHAFYTTGSASYLEQLSPKLPLQPTPMNWQFLALPGDSLGE